MQGRRSGRDKSVRTGASVGAVKLAAAIALVLALGCGASSARPDGGLAGGSGQGGAGNAGSGNAGSGGAAAGAAGRDASSMNEDAAAVESGAGATWSCPPNDLPNTACDGSAGPPPPVDSGAPAGDAGSAAWPSVTDYGATGPFPVARDMSTGPGGGYDVFRPATLGAAGRRHPIVSWANGTLFSLSDYQKLLEHWASHGLVVIAGHTSSTAGGGTHKAAIDWLVAENARASSPYFGVLDTAHVAASGHSQGGGATIAAGAQKPGTLALTTTLPLMPILSFESDTSIVGKQTAPMFNINATMDNRDPTGAVAMQIYTNAKTELVQAAFIGVHEDAMGPAMLAPTLAWFRLELMGDTAASATFFPAGTCGLCRDAAWKQVRYQHAP
jgi:hypothetical protein